MLDLFFNIIIIIIAISFFLIINFYNMKENYKNNKINFQLARLEILFSPIILIKPYITIRLLEKSYKDRYIKLGVVITSEGIADILVGDSPLDLLKERLKLYYELNSDSYKIELILIES